MLTALERGDIMITSRRLTIDDAYDGEDDRDAEDHHDAEDDLDAEDHHDATHAMGNSSSMATNNKMIMHIALLLLVLFI